MDILKDLYIFENEKKLQWNNGPYLLMEVFCIKDKLYKNNFFLVKVFKARKRNR